MSGSILYEKPLDYLLKINHNYYITYPMHRHFAIELIYVRKGKIDVSCDGVDYTIKEGEILFIAPHVAHNYFDSENESEKAEKLKYNYSDFYIFSFTTRCHQKYTSFFCTNTILNPLVSISTTHQDLREIIDRLADKSIVDENPEIVKAYLVILVERLIPMFEIEKNSSEMMREDRTAVIDYINNNYNDPDIGLKKIARETGISEGSISRFFSHTLDINLRKYINSLRIESATRYLRDTSLSIIEIMNECGFQQAASFNRIFLEYTGITPSEYRKKFQHATPTLSEDELSKEHIVYFEQVDRNSLMQYVGNGKTELEPILYPSGQHSDNGDNKEIMTGDYLP